MLPEPLVTSSSRGPDTVRERSKAPSNPPAEMPTSQAGPARARGNRQVSWRARAVIRPPSCIVSLDGTTSAEVAAGRDTLLMDASLSPSAAGLSVALFPGARAKGRRLSFVPRQEEHMQTRRSVSMTLAAFVIAVLPATAHHGWSGNSQDEFELSGTV